MRRARAAAYFTLYCIDMLFQYILQICSSVASIVLKLGLGNITLRTQNKTLAIALGCSNVCCEFCCEVCCEFEDEKHK